MDTPAFNPNPDWGHEDWGRETRAVRDALKAVGVIVPDCLPGEAGDCGEPVWSHYAAYCAMLKARTELMIYANLGEQPGPPGTGITNLAEHFGETVFRHEVAAAVEELGS